MHHRELSFAGHQISIEFESDQIDDLLDFLFGDLEPQEAHKSETIFRVELVPQQTTWRLTREQTELITGCTLNDLGNILAGEVLFSLIEHNRTGLAIHAGLVSTHRGCMLLPADSGSGKSSVTAWLLTQGWHYHTDELVLIDLDSGKLNAFTRPLNIKPSGLEAISEIIDLKQNQSELLVCRLATMIPHRVINPDFVRTIPQLNLIVFPQYNPDTVPDIQRLSGAEAGLELMRSNVIARNLPGHGFGAVTKLVRDIPAYRLHYRHFDDLEVLLGKIEA